MLKKALESQGTSQCGNLIAVALKTVISVHNSNLELIAIIGIVRLNWGEPGLVSCSIWLENQRAKYKCDSRHLKGTTV